MRYRGINYWCLGRAASAAAGKKKLYITVGLCTLAMKVGRVVIWTQHERGDKKGSRGPEHGAHAWEYYAFVYLKSKTCWGGVCVKGFVFSFSARDRASHVSVASVDVRI